MGNEVELMNLLLSSDTQKVENDEELHKNDREFLALHNKKYDSILNSYANNVKDTLTQKKNMKKTFFRLSLIILFVFVVLLVFIVIFSVCNMKNNSESMVGCISALFTVLTSFLTVFIVIPKIIAKYLFNGKEEYAMKEIIANIQDYDKHIRNSISGDNSNL